MEQKICNITLAASVDEYVSERVGVGTVENMRQSDGN